MRHSAGILRIGDLITIKAPNGEVQGEVTYLTVTSKKPHLVDLRIKTAEGEITLSGIPYSTKAKMAGNVFSGMVQERPMVTDVLERAYHLLLKPGCWTQGAEARDSSGKPVHPLNSAAVSFSITGALYAAVPFDGTPEARRLLSEATEALCVKQGIQKWNDDRKRVHQDVLAVLEEF